MCRGHPDFEGCVAVITWMTVPLNLAHGFIFNQLTGYIIGDSHFTYFIIKYKGF